MTNENGNGAADEAENIPTPEADEVEILRAEIAALKDRSLRALAEAENTRKRAEREREEMKQFAIARFARDLLSVSDNLARALAALPGDARDGASDALKAILDGIEATERELQAVLGRHGVKPIEAAGAKFDPNLHQAIAEVPSAAQAPGTVVTVVQGGYTIGERLLRPAMVTVAKAADA
ncbi:MAG: nucleotide exchange factor GrpE [Pseudomonadota bacterium]|jgi:molecular chaperone GrpE